MSDSNIKISKKWFEELRNSLVDEIENIENKKFIVSEWPHKEEGGGKMSKIYGSIIEKGGVNISTVSGKFTKDFSKRFEGTENSRLYKATGISVVIHPQSPHIPSMHFNSRYIETGKSWFGGGIDLTPSLKFDEENEYHTGLRKICEKHNSLYYPKFKKWCDDYFYLSYRKEPRGIGGIFFDNLESNSWEKDFSFVKDIGLFFKEYE